MLIIHLLSLNFIARLLKRVYDLWYDSPLIHCPYNWNMFEKVILSFIPKLNLTGSKRWRTQLCPSRKISSGSVRPPGSLNRPSAGWRMASNWWQRYGCVFMLKTQKMNTKQRWSIGFFFLLNVVSLHKFNVQDFHKILTTPHMYFSQLSFCL